MVAAEPLPLKCESSGPDGQVTYEWETPPPQIDELKQKILSILNREGRSLLALNAPLSSPQCRASIAKKTLELRRS
jgi:hypothetical protein